MIGCDIDVIGAMTTLAIEDENGNVIQDSVLVPGYHVNTLPAIPGLEAYQVTPTFKRRVFAGREDDTACYRFADEAEWLAVANPLGLLEGISHG